MRVFSIVSRFFETENSERASRLRDKVMRVNGDTSLQFRARANDVARGRKRGVPASNQLRGIETSRLQRKQKMSLGTSEYGGRNRFIEYGAPIDLLCPGCICISEHGFAPRRNNEYIFCQASSNEAGFPAERDSLLCDENAERHF